MLKPILSSTLKVCLVLAVIIYASAFGIAFPQSTQSSTGGADGYRLNYFSNANTKGAPDATVRIVNPGTTANDSTGDNGDLCAMIYVFAPDQQLSECCGCKVAASELLSLSVNGDLTGNPAGSGSKLTNGLIEIVSSTPNAGACAPNSPYSVTPKLDEFVTHIQSAGGTANSSFKLTESEFKASYLSASQLAGSEGLIKRCSNLMDQSSSAGQCSCGATSASLASSAAKKKSASTAMPTATTGPR